MTDQVQDRDIIDIRLPKTVEEIIQLANYDDKMKSSEFHILINGSFKKYPYNQTEIYLNGRKVSLSQTVSQGDQLRIVSSSAEDRPTIRSVVEYDEYPTLSISVTFNGESLSIPICQTEILLNGKPATWEQVVEHGDELVIKVGKPVQALFHDVFRYSSRELVMPEGAIQMKTLINGQPADFQTAIHDGDKIELIWEYPR